MPGKPPPPKPPPLLGLTNFQTTSFSGVTSKTVPSGPEQIIVLGPRERRLLEIPLGKVRDLAVRPVINGSGDNVAPWEVEINWVADEPCTATFHYDGVFAEHLARVTESTLRSQWKKGLPVIAQ